MRIVVIGGSGHVGTYLVPRLVEAGHRGSLDQPRTEGTTRSIPPGITSSRWRWTASRRPKEPSGERVLGLEPDVVVDMICFTPASACQLVEALRGRISHLLHCGTIWCTATAHRYRPPRIRRAVLREYGVQKARMGSVPARRSAA